MVKRIEYHTERCVDICRRIIPIVVLVMLPLIFLYLILIVLSSIVLWLLGFYWCADCHKVLFDKGVTYNKGWANEHIKCQECHGGR